MDSTVSFFENDNCYLPDQGNVCHLANKFSKTRRNQFIKYLLSSIFYGFFGREGIPYQNSDINDGIVFFKSLFYISHLSLETRRLISNENNVYFTHKEFTFFNARSELKHHESFHKDPCEVFLFA